MSTSSVAARGPHRLPRTLLAALACALPLAAAAQATAPAVALPLDEGGLRALVERDVGGRGRVELKLGSLDPRMQLAPCRRAEAYLPAGARLWGRGAIGVRCVDGANWNVSLPVTVSVLAKVPVAAAAIPAGTPAEGLALREQEIDLTREATPPLTDLSTLAGRTLARPLAEGQPLRADQFRVTTTIQAGDPVRVHLLGDGFAITADGQAMAAAGEGQPLRVRLESGRVLNGTVRGRGVDVRL